VSCPDGLGKPAEEIDQLRRASNGRSLHVRRRPSDAVRGDRRAPRLQSRPRRGCLPPAVVELRREIRASDALLFSTPEYAGDLPGSFKNLLDWTVGDDQPGSIHTKPVAWVNVAVRGAPHAHESLRRVLGYVGATVIEAACVELPVRSEIVTDDGLVADQGVQLRLAEALEILTEACRSSR
jgi:chromate reductase, NAD(P)H dehydrogenase (quinone)